MQYEVTNSIYTKEIYQIIGIDYIAHRLTHLAVAAQQPGMTEYLLRQRQIQRHQEDRPVNGMETDDILTDQVQIARPVLVKQLIVVAIYIITQTGDVVGQSIQPYVYNVTAVKIYGDTPLKRSTGYAQILQTGQQEVVHHLVLTGYGLNELRMLVDVLDQTIGILAHLKEVSFFLGRLYRTAAVRALAVYQLRLGEERLTGSAVHTFVVALVDVALVVHLLEHLLYLLLMVLVSSTDELIIRSVHQIPDALDLISHTVNENLRGHAGSFSLQLDLLAVLIGTGLETNIVSLLSLVASDTVCQNDLVGITDMRLAGSIGDSGSDVIRFLAVVTHSVSS